VAYDFGFLDTDLPFEKARVAYRVDPWMDTATLDEDFPRNLREQIDRQVREAENQTRRGGAPRDEPE
jgi:hypothetical protein